MAFRIPLLLFWVHCIFGVLNKAYGSFEEDGLLAHNKYRRVHDAPDMSLDYSMTRQATAYAKQLARRGSLQHSSSSQRPGQGENLAMACGRQLSAQQAVEMWYKEVCKFNFNNPGWGYGTGHFTQIVWKQSVELGIGKATSNGCTYVVGRYRPAGNMMNNFRRNVAKGRFEKNSYCSGGGSGNGGGGSNGGGGGGGGGWRPGGGGGWRPVGGGGGGGWRPVGGGGWKPSGGSWGRRRR